LHANESNKVQEQNADLPKSRQGKAWSGKCDWLHKYL